MSVCRKLPDGTVQKIAGHTILLDANASEIREGTIGPLTGTSPVVAVTFSDPMPDTDYVVVFECTNYGGWSNAPGPITITNKTITGFNVSYYCYGGVTSPGLSFKYTAWKPVKIEGYTELQNKINNPDDTPTIDSMNLVTSDGVARAIENASAVWKGTKAEWNALPAADKMKYDLAVLIDQTLVKAIDRDDGTETNVADLSGQFVGTHAEWEAESNKTQYKTAVLTDDRKTVNEVTGTGALNEVADDARIWRGTKAEWDALTAAEKDKWDQAEIETIEAQGLNPFRTLSDPEQITLAGNVDYECPHDGFINISVPTGSGSIEVYINGKRWSSSYTVQTNEVNCIPVQQGDILKYTGTTSTIYARWYTTDINPGNPIDYPVVHRSQSLDWDNSITVSYLDLNSGYTVQHDGFFVHSGKPLSAGSTFYINGIAVGTGYFYSGSYEAAYNVQIPVCKGDVITLVGSGASENGTIVPYKDYPDYSTTEHWTGKRWIDGKKIYSKVVTGLSVTINPYTNWINVCSVPNADTLVSYRAKSASNTDWSSNVLCAINSGTCQMYNCTTLGFACVMVILEYTKTTDD